MERRGAAVAFAVACALLAGCTASSSDEEDVEVLAEVIEREVPAVDQAPSSDDGGSAAAAERDATEAGEEDGTEEHGTAASGVEAQGEGEAPDGAAAAGADEDAPPASAEGDTRRSASAGEASGPPRPSAPPTSAPAPRREPAPQPRPGPAPQPRPGPAPQPPPPSPRALGSTEVVSAGVLASTDGSWVETSSTVHDRDADPDPLVIDLRASAGEEDTQQVGCVPRLVASADRGLLVRGELVVSVVTESGEEVSRQPRVRIPLDVELAAGEELELPASRPLTVRHGEVEARYSCLAVLTTAR